MTPTAPSVLYILWTADAEEPDEAELDGRFYLTEEEAIEHAKSVAGEIADINGGKCAVYRCDLTRVGIAFAREADYERSPS